MSKAAIKAYLAAIGAKGGEATGESKKRGDKAYYKALSKKAVAAKKKNAKKKK